jgi:hypothetical protein
MGAMSRERKSTLEAKGAERGDKRKGIAKKRVRKI